MEKEGEDGKEKECGKSGWRKRKEIGSGKRKGNKVGENEEERGRGLRYMKKQKRKRKGNEVGKADEER